MKNTRARSAVVTGGLLVLSAIAAPAGAQTVVVSGSGATFTNPTSVNASDPACAAAVDTWCARNVRNNGVVGITTNYARSGNGSAYFRSPQAGASSSKADLEIYFGTGTLLSDVQALGYDWYRNSASTNNPIQTPSLRLILGNSASPLSFNSYLIYEPYYSQTPGWTAPTDAWQTSSIGASGIFWRSGQANPTYQSLASWQASLAGLYVIGLSTGVGSGWDGDFIGAVDNVSYRTAGMNQAVTYNFEVATVPEPSTWALMAGGLLGLGTVAARRRRQG